LSSLIDTVMEHTLVYRAWQAPFAERKFAPVIRHNDLGAVRSVLDVGCGPGTNAAHFGGSEYVGIDINPSYIASAQRRYAGDFRAADICTYEPGPGDSFDFVLVNSFLHHVDDPEVKRILGQVRGLLTGDGHVHVLELLLPGDRSLAHRLAEWDRGAYPRYLNDWAQLFEEEFETVVLEPYPLGVRGLTLWNMVYFKGRVRA
jgi:SAM-dependent methyltransferase